jgi:uncharacterized protein YdhG (YjbR/CyaY superfamily)
VPAKPRSVDEYIESLSGPARQRMSQLRELALAAAPEATETLKWGDPAYVHPSGVILFILSGHRAHANFVLTPTTREAFDDELAEYETGKGSVKLPYDRPVPTDLLTRMVHHRIREHEVEGIKWL